MVISCKLFLKIPLKIPLFTLFKQNFLHEKKIFFATDMHLDTLDFYVDLDFYGSPYLVVYLALDAFLGLDASLDPDAYPALDVFLDLDIPHSPVLRHSPILQPSPVLRPSPVIDIYTIL